jgi:hypothetical protein
MVVRALGTVGVVHRACKWVLGRAGHGVVMTIVTVQGAPAMGSMKVLVQQHAKAPSARVCVCHGLMRDVSAVTRQRLDRRQ